MNRVIKLLVGVGVGIGVVASLVVLFLRGEKTRGFLSARWQQVQSALPESEHVQRYARQVTDRVAQAAGELQGTAQQAMEKVKNAGGDLGDLAQQAGTTLKQTSQDVADKTRQLVKPR